MQKDLELQQLQGEIVAGDEELGKPKPQNSSDGDSGVLVVDENEVSSTERVYSQRGRGVLPCSQHAFLLHLLWRRGNSGRQGLKWATFNSHAHARGHNRHSN